MREVIHPNIWTVAIGNWVVIPTNGFVKVNGECVMGRGVAQQAARMFPWLPLMLGTQLRKTGNKLYLFEDITRGYRLITFPVKHNWWEKADLDLIRTSTKELGSIKSLWSGVYLPHVGCGNGQLDWADVQPILEEYLDDRFTVVTQP